jgi:outer membrane protein assembly factor BamB
VNVMHIGQWGHMEKRGGEYVRASAYGPYARFWNRETRVPCQNPPFGEMVAVDLGTGDVAWRSPLGRIESLEAVGVRDTGSVNLGGSIATAGGLVFIGASNDARFHAYESGSGKLLWEVKLEASGHTNPITYMGRDGRQYVAIMASGGGGFLGGAVSDTLVGFALPDVARKALPRVVTAKSAAAASGKGTVLPGKTLVERTCAVAGCHGVEVVKGQKMTKAEWSGVVRNMVARGAKATDAEVEAIVEYLAGR